MMFKKLGEAIPLLNIVFSIAAKNHINYGESCHASFLFNPK